MHGLAGTWSIALLLALVLSARAAAQPAGFVEGLPDANRVLGEVRGANAADTTARQAAAFQVLARWIEQAMRLGAASDPRRKPGDPIALSSAATRLMRDYAAAQQKVIEAFAKGNSSNCSTPPCPFVEMTQASAQLVLSPEFERDLTNRFTSASWQQQFAAMRPPLPAALMAQAGRLATSPAAGAAPAAASPIDPRATGWLQGAPPAEQVLAAVRSGNEFESTARQLAALRIARDNALEQIGSRQYQREQMYEAERALLSSYGRGMREINEALKARWDPTCRQPDCEQFRHHRLRMALEQSDAFKREVWTRTTESGWRERHVKDWAVLVAAGGTVPTAATAPTVEQVAIGKAVAGAGVDVTIFGLTLDKPLTLPRCSTDFAAVRPDVSEAEKRRFIERASGPQREFCWMATGGLNALAQLLTTGNPDAFVSGATALILLPQDRCPAWVKHCTLYADVDQTHGVLRSVSIVTQPERDAEVQQMLRGKYGKPTSSQTGQIVNKLGARMDTEWHEWQLAGLHVAYQSLDTSYENGFLRVLGPMASSLQSRSKEQQKQREMKF
jgi:hypothetical protein